MQESLWRDVKRQKKKQKRQSIPLSQTKSKAKQYWRLVHKTGNGRCRRKRKCRGCDFVSRFGDKDQKTQEKMIKDLLKMPIDALAVSTVNSYDNADYIELAKNRDQRMLTIPDFWALFYDCAGIVAQR